MYFRAHAAQVQRWMSNFAERGETCASKCFTSRRLQKRRCRARCTVCAATVAM